MKQRDSFQLSGAHLRRAVILMFVSLGVMIAGLSCIYFSPWPWAPWFALAIYLGLAWAERGIGVTSPVTITMIVANLAMGITAFLIVDFSALLMFAPIIYALLAIVTGLYQWHGLPFTAIYTQGEGYHELHELNSLAWCALFILSCLTSFLLAPSIWFIIVPFGLMIFGALLTLFLHFVTMGRAHERQKHFVLGDFKFSEVEDDPDGLEMFYQVVATSFRTEFQRNFGTKHAVKTEKIVATHKLTDETLQGSMIRFIAKKGDRAVGAVALFFDHPEKGLPLESVYSDIGIDQLRQDGLVAEVCRLSIANNYRNNPTLFKGLVRCMIDLASEHQVAHLVNDAFLFRLGTYRKIGFLPMIEDARVTPVDSLGFSMPMQALSMNYKRVVLLENVSATTREMYTVINLYLTERYFNRLVARDLIAKALNVRGWFNTEPDSTSTKEIIND